MRAPKTLPQPTTNLCAMACLVTVLLTASGCKPSESAPIPEPTVDQNQIKPTASSSSPPQEFTPEALRHLQKADTAEQIGSYAEAAKHVQRALESDPSHPEMLFRMGKCFFQGQQPLKQLASLQAYVHFCQETENRQKVLHAIEDTKRKAEDVYESLLSEARSGWLKLPGGADYSVRAAGLPADIEAKYDRLTKEFQLEYSTHFAICEALIKRGSNSIAIKDNVAYLNRRSTLWNNRPNIGEAVQQCIDRLISANDFETLRAITRWDVGFSWRGFDWYVESQVPQIAKALEPEHEARDKLGQARYPGHPNYDEKAASAYLATIDRVWKEHARLHPIKPASLQDWLDFISDTPDPLEGDFKAQLEDLRTVPKEAPMKLAKKAGEIGEFLWKLELLERRSAQPNDLAK